MRDIDWERLVVVVAIHGEKFLGWVPPECEHQEKYMKDAAQSGGPVRLLNARNLVGQCNPSVDASGNVIGIQKLLLLMPIDGHNGPLSEYYVVPSSWYFPKNTGEYGQVKISGLLEHALEMEARMTAAAAGLHVAKSMPGMHS